MYATVHKGQTVYVYEDPLSCARLEGKAELLKIVQPEDMAGISRWTVRFESDRTKGSAGMVVDRFINSHYASIHHDNGFIHVTHDEFAALTIGLKGNPIQSQTNYPGTMAAMQYSITDGNAHRLFAQAIYQSLSKRYEVARWYIMGLAEQWQGNWHDTIITAIKTRLTQLDKLVDQADKADTIDLDDLDIPDGTDFRDAIDIVNTRRILRRILSNLGGSQ